MKQAEKINAQPLPLIPEKYGLRIPPERVALTGSNFKVIPLVNPFSFNLS